MKNKATNPVILAGRARFEWHGPRAPQLMGDFNHWDAANPITLSPAGHNLWQHTLELPEDAYLEYVYLLDGKRLVDPRNPQRVFNGINAYNHYFYMPDAQPSDLVNSRQGVAHGTVKRMKVKGSYHLGDKNHAIDLFEREVYFYRPPVDEPVPLLVVYDGPDYLRRAKLPAIVDNLIHQKRIRPLALAMLANGRKNRFLEYACSDVTLGFIDCGLLPLARSELNLLDPDQSPGSYGVLGASLGGLMALYTGLRRFEIFGKVLSQSGAFYPGFVLNDLVKNKQGQQSRVWIDVGTFEYLLSFNRQMWALLVEQGYQVAYHEYNAGHNYTAWRDDVANGLECLFG